MAILESFWRSLVAREVAKQIEVVFKITGGVTKFLRAQLSENSRVLRRGGTIDCVVTGGRRHSSDLPQGGLEIPCRVKFTAKPEQIKTLKRALKLKNKTNEKP